MTSKFTLRLVEQMAAAGGAAFLGLLAASDGSVTRGVLAAALAAAVRAVYGVFAKNVGEDPDAPSVK